MEKKTKLDLIKEGYEAARDNKPEKKYPIGDMVMPADKVAFIKEAIQKLKASNKSDYESGEFDVFNHKQEGRYGAFEEVLQWLTQATPQGIEWVKASERMPKEAGPITWRWLDKEAAYSGFNGTAFIYDKGGAQVDMLYAIEIEWLDETGQSQQPGREVNAEIDRRNKLLEDDLKRQCRLNMPGISEAEQENVWQAYKGKHRL